MGQVDFARLRRELHVALDRALDELVAMESRGADADPVKLLGTHERFVYRWPALREEFEDARIYEVRDSGRDTRLVVAWTVRNAWGRDRRRSVVFLQRTERDGPRHWYPLTEFVETDAATFAAPVPDPSRPRAVLTDADELPERFQDSDVKRSDELFKTIDHGPSLRLVVEVDDEKAMALHGHWVGLIRGRL